MQIVIKDILSENNFKINNIYDFKSSKIESISNKTIESKLQQLSKKISKNKFNISFSERDELQNLSKNLISLNKSSYDLNRKNIKSLIKKSLITKSISRKINNIANKYTIKKRIIDQFIKHYINNIIVNNYDEKLKINLKELKNIFRLKIDTKTAILNSFFLVLINNVSYNKNDKMLSRTNYGFKNINIYGNNKFFFLSKRFLQAINSNLYSINNILNFNILNIKEILKKIDN